MVGIFGDGIVSSQTLFDIALINQPPVRAFWHVKRRFLEANSLSQALSVSSLIHGVKLDSYNHDKGTGYNGGLVKCQLGRILYMLLILYTGRLNLLPCSTLVRRVSLSVTHAGR